MTGPTVLPVREVVATVADVTAHPSHVVQSAQPLLLVVLLGGLVVSSLLVVGGALAWRRRGSVPYLLVALALGTLAVKGIVGVSVVLDTLPMSVHHTVEHGLDLLMGVLLVGAVVFARRWSRGDPT